MRQGGRVPLHRVNSTPPRTRDCRTAAGEPPEYDPDMPELEFSRGRWLPSVLRVNGRLRLEILGGADGLGSVRRFTVPVSEQHVARIRDDLPRHVLARAALIPLCYAAGSLKPLDEPAAVRLLDTVLYGDEAELDAVFRAVSWDSRCALIAHGANPALLDAGKMLAAARSVSAVPSWDRVREYMESQQPPGADSGPLRH